MTTEDTKIERVIQHSLDNYLNNHALRNAIWQIPGIGSMLDYVIVSAGQEFQKRRLLQAIQYLNEAMSLIEDVKIDKSFLATEEFYDIMRLTLDECLRTGHNEKIRLNCKILVGSVVVDNTDERHSAADFISFISELSLTDILVASEIYKKQKDMPERFDMESNENTELKFVVNNGWHNIRDICKLSETDFSIALTKLSRAGLIKETLGTYVGYGGGLYLITPAFKRLMKLIQYFNEPLFSYHTGIQ